MNRLGRVQSG